ncbi:phytanoyl-CoA dioxygenase family protein [Mycobacterium sp. G7A2]|uniref:phytanoyl-CoA dioxygenase family protein n=1 Tax=Mycobacterium sp. G7A2 TaxID=3317307 RepID=UPI0035A85BCD
MRQALDKDGIFIVRDALSQDEIEELRDILVHYLPRRGRRFGLGKTQPNAAQQAPELAFVFAHPRILAVVKQVLGETDVVFTGHCDIHMNMLSGWHKDSGETVPGGYFTGPYMSSEDCRVYKVAIYLQDTGKRDGFTARLGSHREVDLSVGEAVSVQSRRGDIVVFDVRITHTGQLPDPVEKGLKGLNLALNHGHRDREDRQWVSRIKSSYWKLIGRRDRLSVFFTYGAPNSFTDDFARANMSRQARQGSVGPSAGLPPELGAALERGGVKLSGALRSQDCEW